MRIDISGRGVGVPAALRSQLETKLSRATRFLTKITEARMVLGRERYRHRAHVTLQAKGVTLRAEAAASDVHAAVDLAVDHLEAQVRRRKDRIRGRPPRPSRRGPVAETPGSIPHALDDGSGLVVRRLRAKSMSVDEALESMRTRPRSLLIFTNAQSGLVNVLHRRTDGRLELVQPIG